MPEINSHELWLYRTRKKTRLRYHNNRNSSRKPVRKTNSSVPQPKSLDNVVLNGKRCLVLSAIGISPEVEGIAYFNYNAHSVLVGVSMRTDSTVRCITWLRQPSTGTWRRIDLRPCGLIWVGCAHTQAPLNQYDRCVVTTETETEPLYPSLRQAVLAGYLDDACEVMPD